ncbi:MAG: response regulator [Candidatus Heimdallarchaeota archaeon]|nr:response regulator [Candidatus Heimdallarchaeota archaeon]
MELQKYPGVYNKMEAQNEKLHTKHNQLVNQCKESSLKILSVEDSEDDFYLINTYIKSHLELIELDHAKTISEMNEMMRHVDFDLILLDLFLGGDCSIKLIPKLKHDYPNMEILVISAQDDIRTALECIELGASYIAKGKFLETDLIKTLYQLKRIISSRRENSILKDIAFQSENIPLVFLKMNDIDYLVYKDFDQFPEELDESLEVFLHKFGTYSIVGIGQGEAYNVGLYQLPAVAAKRFTSFVYALRLEDKEANDSRLELGFFLFCLFIPNNLVRFIRNLEELEKQFEYQFRHIKSLDELSGSYLDKIKRKILRFIKKQIE